MDHIIIKNLISHKLVNEIEFWHFYKSDRSETLGFISLLYPSWGFCMDVFGPAEVPQWVGGLFLIKEH